MQVLECVVVINVYRKAFLTFFKYFFRSFFYLKTLNSQYENIGEFKTFMYKN